MSRYLQSLDSLDFHFRDEGLLGTTEKGGAATSFKRAKQTRRCWRLTGFQITIIGLLAVAATLLPILFFLKTANHHHHVNKAPTGIEFGSCGNNRTTALANCCIIFDNLSYSWVQPACHHPLLLKNFQDRHEIGYYYSPTRSPESRIPIEEIMDGRHPSVFADQEQHPMHCAFMLAKLHEAFVNGSPTDNLVRIQEHTEHCTEILLDSWLHEVPPCTRKDGCISRVNMAYTSCGYF
ncbi:hypothetical protein BKA65DRAFT_29557 [Rhexocercosporidium sp. MPI-PUGE-AT-0058]|nr:hypothetical protein BKA65DRAFT_29557 [Rhexocercosporidium sp. MPI-PUGE-AT-0058]